MCLFASVSRLVLRLARRVVKKRQESCVSCRQRPPARVTTGGKRQLPRRHLSIAPSEFAADAMVRPAENHSVETIRVCSRCVLCAAVAMFEQGEIPQLRRL